MTSTIYALMFCSFAAHNPNPVECTLTQPPFYTESATACEQFVRQLSRKIDQESAPGKKAFPKAAARKLVCMQKQRSVWSLVPNR